VDEIHLTAVSVFGHEDRRMCGRSRIDCPTIHEESFMGIHGGPLPMLRKEIGQAIRQNPTVA
jgi:hypothetical protein